MIIKKKNIVVWLLIEVLLVGMVFTIFDAQWWMFIIMFGFTSAVYWGLHKILGINE